MENERIATVIGKLQGSSLWKMPDLSDLSRTGRQLSLHPGQEPPMAALLKFR